MAMGIVDRLEAVQVAKQDGQPATGAPRARQHVIGQLIEQGPAGQAGQVVVLGQMDRLIGG